jgi:hypothetical protein
VIVSNGKARSQQCWLTLQPLFRITSSDTQETFTGNTPSHAWSLVLRKCKEVKGESFSGPSVVNGPDEVFSSGLIVQVMSSLDLASGK